MRRTVLLSCFLLVCDQRTYVRSADEAVIGVWHIADAAFPRKCSDPHFPAQRISPNQPFKRNTAQPFQTDLSLRLDRNSMSRTNRTYAVTAIADAAFACSCSRALAAMRRVSLNRPFKRGSRIGYQTDLSLRGARTHMSRDLPRQY